MIKLTDPVIDEDEIEAVRRVLESGWLVEGKVTKQFEEGLAEYVGAKYAIAVANCTVALELCLKAQDIRGEVILPDFTYPGTANAVYNAGATPVLVDVDIDTYNITMSEIVKAITVKTEAVMPVSWGGNPLWCFQLPSIIIEDAACGLGSQFNHSKTGSRRTTCFSFHPRKLIACGTGGMITTNDEALANKIRALKNFGFASDFQYKHGTNNKFNDVLSAIGLAQLHKLEAIIAKRVQTAKVYSDLLSEVPNVRTPEKHPLARHTYQTYAVYLEKGDRDTIIKRLAASGIETQIGTYALHLLPAFKNTRRIGKLENATNLYRHLLALPMPYHITEGHQKHVVSELKKYVR